MPTIAASRVCSQCNQAKAIDHFRRRRCGSEHRMCQCRACHNAAERDRRSNRKSRQIQSFASAVNSARSPSRVAALASGIVCRMGGTSGFAHEWHTHIVAAAQKEPGGRTVLKSLHAVARIVEAASTSGAEPDRNYWSDEQLEEMFFGILPSDLG